MLLRMLCKDLSRNRVVSAALFLFLALSSLLLSAAAGIAAELSGAMDALFERSVAPHFVQMHSGEISRADIDAFAAGHGLVVAQQTHEMLTIPGSSVYLGDSGENEARSVVDLSFVRQNPTFDLLLGLDSEPLEVSDGEIAVPLYFLRQNNLSVGDPVLVSAGSFSKAFTIVDFVRDVQMNPSLVTSKRFVVSTGDWAELRANVGESEYLIEFLLRDASLAGEFERDYLASGLPAADTAITYSLFRLLSAVTDGLVAAVIGLISLLLTAIALLCLRYTIVASLEEDRREIGVLKAIGGSGRRIRGIYLAKYLPLAGAACLCGSLLSVPLGRLFTANISLYMGSAPPSAARWLAPLGGGLCIFALASLCTCLALRRFRLLSAVEALRDAVPVGKTGGGMPVHRSRFPYLNVHLGVREVLLRPGSHATLCAVFLFCVFLATLPVNLLSTLRSPDFISYMGAGRSDLRVDLQASDDTARRYGELMDSLERDPEVARFAGFVTRGLQAVGADGLPAPLKVETGDFSVFPVAYLSGTAPVAAGEIALSAMNAEELNKGVGDFLTVLDGNSEAVLTVCGVYQDVTNGGKTAKAVLPGEPGDALWYVVNLDLAPGVDPGGKKAEYAAAFAPAKVLDMEEYLSQTLGALTGQLHMAAVCGVAVSTVLCALVTAMFLRMTLAKEAARVAVLRSIGFSPVHLRTQYVSRTLLVLLSGILAGTLATATLGQGLAGALLSTMGAASLQFSVNPLVSYAALPLLLACAVAVTTALCTVRLKKTDSLQLSME